MSIRTFGLDAFRIAIDRSLDLAALARERIEASDELELLAPPSLGIVCFRRRFDGDDEALERSNSGLVAALEQSGLGLISSTRLRGRHALRMCVLNHATSAEDVERVLDFLENAEPAESIAPEHERHPDVGAAGDLSRSSEPINVDELRRHGTEREAPAGEALIARWDSTRDFFYILDGTVEVTIDDQHVAELGPGEFFGELAALEWGAGFAYPRLATVTAVTPLRVLVFAAESLDELFRSLPELERQIRRHAGLRVLRH